jgi:hypothetical protein
MEPYDAKMPEWCAGVAYKVRSAADEHKIA